MPNNLIARHGAELTPTLLMTALSLGLASIAALGLGRLSDRIGRRPVVTVSAAALAGLAPPLSILATRGSVLGLFLAGVVISVAVGGVLSMAMVGELFPAPVRSTGFALSAGLATAVIGGTAPLVDQLLVTVVHTEAAPGLYVTLAALVALAALRRWPETAFKRWTESARHGSLGLSEAGVGIWSVDLASHIEEHETLVAQGQQQPVQAAASARSARRVVSRVSPCEVTPSKFSSTSFGTSPSTRISYTPVASGTRFTRTSLSSTLTVAGLGASPAAGDARTGHR